MTPFNGFEEILMAVIRGTSHADDIDNYGRQRKTDEQRFDEAMIAIFGSQYEPRFKDTADVSTKNLLQIEHLVKSGHKFRAAVREVMRDKLPESDGSKADRLKQDAVLDRLAGQVRKHFEAYEQHYKEFLDIGEQPKMKKSSLDSLLKEEENARENIFKALREAGWDI
jgi:hypothetical protein